ncbi:tRNA pseudouridine(55) synthase TruB [bacterium]|nr:tRNA pseudouridine(55) synthase TruB [bacterium]
MEEQPQGMILIDKPLEWTSFDVVKKMRRLAQIKKVGHAGTLDPLATGLLIVCFGKYTKKIEGIQALKKEYTGTFKIGSTTPSFDLETEEDGSYETDHITLELLEEAASGFIGDIEQVPPIYSAVKIDGKRAYEHARKGEDVKMKSRIVHIEEFEITRVELPEVDFRIVCSKGTYIRSIARDFGEALNSGAHLISLRRTAIGPYKVEDAHAPTGIADTNDFYLQSIK